MVLIFYMKKNQYNYLLLILSFIFLTDCNWLDDAIVNTLPCSRNLVFEIPLNLSNAQDSFNLGDSIWVSAQFNEVLIDSITKDLIETNDYPFATFFNIIKYDERVLKFGQTYFNYQEITGNLQYLDSKEYENDEIKGDRGLYQVNYYYQDKSYNLKFGLIPQITGTYVIEFVSLPPSSDNGDSGLIKDCKSTVEIYYKMNSGDPYDNNYQMFLNSNDSFLLYRRPKLISVTETSYSLYKRTAAYSFVVKE